MSEGSGGRVVRFVAVIAALLIADSATATDRRVAFTFDDLPGLHAGTCAESRALNQRFVSAMARDHMPGSRVCDNSALEIWLDAGLRTP